jgi:hypothetical protein
MKRKKSKKRDCRSREVAGYPDQRREKRSTQSPLLKKKRMRDDCQSLDRSSLRARRTRDRETPSKKVSCKASSKVTVKSQCLGKKKTIARQSRKSKSTMLIAQDADRNSVPMVANQKRNQGHDKNCPDGKGGNQK